MTVDSIEVSNQLTIGGAPPLGQDAINKIQAQIIAPSQVLYVDQKNGNDNNDGTTQATAVRTLDKAVSLIRKNIPTLTINLTTYTEPENQIYNTFSINKCINNDNLQVDTFRFVGTWDTFRTSNIVAKINVPYGNVDTGVYDYSTSPNAQYFQWGRFFIKGAINLYLQSTIFEFENDTSDTTKYRNSVVYGLEKSFEIRNVYGNTMTLPANCSMLNINGDINIEVIYLNAGNDFRIEGNNILIDASQSNLYKTDPKTTDGGGNTNGGTYKSFITKYISLGTYLAPAVSGGTKGLASNVVALFTNGFD